MDEEVLIPRGRLTWDHCEAASSPRIINHQEPCSVSVLGLCETEQGRACLHSASQKSSTPSSSQGKGQQLSHAAGHGQQAHPQLKVSQETLFQEDGTVAMHTHVCSYAHSPTCPAAFGLAAAVEGNVEENSLKYTQLQADSINQWDARLQPGCSARSCCCCVNPQCLVTAVKDFSEWTPLPLGKHRVIPAGCCHINCVYVHSF